MRMSKLFGQTLREIPVEAEVVSHQLLLRAGFIRQLAAGIFSYLPLARRSLTKIENIIRAEMDAIGGQEITMPVIHPGDLWQETGRWYEIGAEMSRFQDRSKRDMVLAMTHEEVIGDLVRKELRSYRQLPLLLYQIQTKWRDDPRPRSGLIRVREFTMKDSYSLDATWEGLDVQYQRHYQAYFNIFHRCGLPVMAVRSDVGMMGGKMAHEFIYLTPIGEDTLFLCEACGYAANRQIAQFAKPSPQKEKPKPLQKIATPGVTTIDALARFLNISKAQTAKAVFMIATVVEDHQDVDKFVLAQVRGDMDLNEAKLANAVKAKELRPACDDEIRQVGVEPGYGSALGVKDVIVVVDDIISDSPNLVAGANQAGYHFQHVNYGRDYQADLVCDIGLAQEGDACPECHSPMRASRGVEVGNIFKLGTRYSEALGCHFVDQDNRQRPVIMGSYGIGVGRLLACIAEEYHDQDGLIWPLTVAPYQVHLVGLVDPGGRSEGRVNSLYDQLRSEGIEVLYDDRPESAGVKFKDADLIGIPIRLTAGERSLQRGEVEIKQRRAKERANVPIGEAVGRLKAQLAALQEEIAQGVVERPFKE